MWPISSAAPLFFSSGRPAVENNVLLGQPTLHSVSSLKPTETHNCINQKRNKVNALNIDHTIAYQRMSWIGVCSKRKAVSTPIKVSITKCVYVACVTRKVHSGADLKVSISLYLSGDGFPTLCAMQCIVIIFLHMCAHFDAVCTTYKADYMISYVFGEHSRASSQNVTHSQALIDAGIATHKSPNMSLLAVQ